MGLNIPVCAAGMRASALSACLTEAAWLGDSLMEWRYYGRARGSRCDDELALVGLGWCGKWSGEV